MWFGFYANAFDMIQRCYEEWSPPESYPIRPGMRPSRSATTSSCSRAGATAGRPGTCTWTPTTRFRAPITTCRATSSRACSTGCCPSSSCFAVETAQQRADATRGRVGAGRSCRRRCRDRHRSWPRARLGLAAAAPLRPSDDRIRGRGSARGLGCPTPGTTRRVAAGPAQAPRVQGRARAVARPRWCTELAIMLTSGSRRSPTLIADDVLAEGFGELNREDLWAWLRRHGAEQVTLEHAAVIKALYDLVFAYRDGDKRRPTWLRARRCRRCHSDRVRVQGRDLEDAGRDGRHRVHPAVRRVAAARDPAGFSTRSRTWAFPRTAARWPRSRCSRRYN